MKWRSEKEVLDELMMPKYNYLEDIPEEVIKLRLNNFKELKIGGCDSLDVMSMLKLHRVTIKNRAMILEEAGFYKDMITVSTLKTYLQLAKHSVKILKKLQFMSMDNNVIKSMVKYVDVDESECVSFTDNMTILEAKNFIMRKYLEKRLGMKEENLQPVQLFHLQRMKHKSLRILKENIDLCENNIGLPTKKVAANMFLLYQNTENTYKIINQVKQIGGVDVKEVLRSNPKILSESVENMQDIKATLKEFNIPEKVATGLKRVLTLNAKTVRQRILDLDEFEFLSACRNHPRVYDIIFYHRKVAKRLKLLDEIRLNSVTVNALASGTKNFNKYYDHGYDRTSGRDTIYFLSKEFNRDKGELRAKLKCHPFWEHIPLIHIWKIATHLKERFTTDEIYKNIYILLYPLKKIEKELEMMESRPELNSFKTDGKVRSDMVLPLVIYYIEKANNFNYNGVWDYDSEAQQLGFDVPLQYKVSL
ncbi:transcription termination factor 5, mitochondrial isoform X2 [Cimex lectularius]|uniref:Transcription termination factor 5, mitochondrial n=1 Tax=Cimex lectularius TaxID=79782 RepID=A0A8I6TEI8_CIMLE|nr:transcription termination factor 5, mitochondrial isoform X2 [Cimex lectularius]